MIQYKILNETDQVQKEKLFTKALYRGEGGGGAAGPFSVTCDWPFLKSVICEKAKFNSVICDRGIFYDV